MQLNQLSTKMGETQYSLSVFSFVNIASIPTPEQLTSDDQSNEFAAFYHRSNKLGKVYLVVFAASVVVLFVLAAI